MGTIIKTIVRLPSLSKPKPEHNSRRYKSDLILPFNHLDNLKAWRSGIAVNTLRFNARMDVGKLKAALERLLNKDGWRKLGGRIRYAQDNSNNLEHHIPAAFDADRPAFTWSHENHGQSIQVHPIASRIPSSSAYWDEPQFFEDTHTTTDFLYPPQHLPTKFREWTESDRGCLAFHIHTFFDATLISIGWCHAWMDALGIADILHAWSLTLNGREDEVLEYVDRDAVGEYLRTVEREDNVVVPERHCLYESRLKGAQKCLSLATTMSDFLLHPSKINEERTVVLPPSYVSALKSRAASDLNGTQIVSENDVLFAWRTKLLTSLLSLPASTPIGLLQPYSVRGLFPTLPLNKAFTSNSTCFAYTGMTAGEVRKESLGAVARRIRNDLRVQRTKEMAEAWVRLVGREGLVMVGDWRQVLMGWSNWTRGELWGVDFGGAVVEDCDELQLRVYDGTCGAAGGAEEVTDHNDNGCAERSIEDVKSNVFCMPSYINTHAHFQGPKFRNAGCLLGRDQSGNRWMYWSMRSELWEEAKERILRNDI